MKRFYLLIFLILPHFLLAQPFSLHVQDLSATPAFQDWYVLSHGTRRVVIRTTVESGTQRVERALVRHYNDFGLLSKEIEIEAQDTSRIDSFHYNSQGFLGWKQTSDLHWGKVYRTGYRFNGARQKFQEHEYQLLDNEQVMLLESRQYVYNADSQLVAIRWREGDHISRVHRYRYNERQQLMEEQVENADQEVLSTVTYAYTEQGNVAEVTLQQGNQSMTYQYSYNEQGYPTRIEWQTNDEAPAGHIDYQYDEAGLLTALQRQEINGTVTTQTFTWLSGPEYDNFPGFAER